ncbi:hypothetical protein K466DRAFT_501748 [Polyporus arcularius HHB13444]|uniref:Uncharacterized protein n=1 Tax=Polyporus arcularius HHB13444 TaxID=1314778 RepID=A0A5C3P7D8_9APHY|nr:hypothetical protein K466DRAFT_501748 [Polyporus arcularius HHB13444]
MDADQLVRLKATCSLADQYVAAVLHTRSRKLLDHGLRSYDAFVAILAHTRAVVGGIAALYLLFPYHGRPPFVDVFVPDDTYDEFMGYLLFEEGFSFTRVEPGSVEEEQEDEVVRGDHEQGGFCINLVRSTSTSALLPITSELHTALFNYVTPHGFCSAYTGFNRLRRALLNPVRLDDDYLPPKFLRPAFAAWARNGWDLNLVPIAFPDAGRCRGVQSIACASATRHFGDRHCTFGRIAPIRLRYLEPRLEDDRDDPVTVVWWRGGVTCAATCHSGSRHLAPGARMCLRTVAETS